MTGCYTCGGGMGKHDPVAHDQVPEDDEPCMCGTDFTCMADEHCEWVCIYCGEPHEDWCPRLPPLADKP